MMKPEKMASYPDDEQIFGGMSVDPARLLASAPTVPNAASQVGPQLPPQKAPIGGDLEGLLRSKYKENIEDRNKTIGVLQNKLNKFNEKPNQTNLLPFLSAVDAMTGSKIAESYKAPMTDQQREDYKLRLEKLIQDAKSGGIKSDLDFLKAEISYAKKSGSDSLKRLSIPEIRNLSESQTTVKLAGGLLDTIDKNEKIMGPVTGIGALFPYSEEQRNLQAKFDLVRQKVGKMLEGGVLRKEDEAKYKKILPLVTDTPAVARSKAEQLRQVLEEDLGQHLKNLKTAGYNTSGITLPKQSKSLSEKKEADQKAIEWANANKQDPRAQKILQLNKGL